MNTITATTGILAFCISSLQANTYQGTISGMVTSAQDAAFQTFGTLNSPLFVGDEVLGTYTYEAPTLNGSHTATVQFRVQVGLMTISSSTLTPDFFDVADGEVTNVFAVLDSSSFPNTPNFSSHLSLSHETLHFVESTGDAWHSMEAVIVWSAPRASDVPDVGSASLLLFLAYMIIGVVRGRRGV